MHIGLRLYMWGGIENLRGASLPLCEAYPALPFYANPWTETAPATVPVYIYH